MDAEAKSKLEQVFDECLNQKMSMAETIAAIVDSGAHIQDGGELNG